MYRQAKNTIRRIPIPTIAPPMKLAISKLGLIVAGVVVVTEAVVALLVTTVVLVGASVDVVDWVVVVLGVVVLLIVVLLVVVGALVEVEEIVVELISVVVVLFGSVGKLVIFIAVVEDDGVVSAQLAGLKIPLRIIIDTVTKKLSECLHLAMIDY